MLAPEAERVPIESTEFCLAECRWAARNESVVHLDDLLLRRTRLGSLLRMGGAEALFRAAGDHLRRGIALGRRQRWQAELARYREIWLRHYFLPAELKPLLRSGDRILQ